jgi:tetratricopeptide (TPR) repeat protein
MASAITPKQIADQAQSEYRQKKYMEAANTYLAAARVYQDNGDTLSSAEMLNNASVSHLQADDPQAALDAVSGTAEIFAEAGDLRRQGLALGNLGSALEALDRLEEAAQMYQRSGEILQEAGEHQLRANVMQSLSALQLRTGRQLEALVSMQSGLETIERPNPKQRFLKKLLRVPYKFIK